MTCESEVEEALAALPPAERLERRVLDSCELDDPGIPFRVTLVDAVVAMCDRESGEIITTAIPDFEQLTAALAVLRAHHQRKLNGTELRFLRRAMGLSARGLARKLHVDAATLSRWEHEHAPLGEQSERLLRLLAVELLAERAAAVPTDRRWIIEMGLKAASADAVAWRLRRVQVKREPSSPAREAWDELPEAA